MQSLLEFAPLLAFGATFFLRGIYAATAVLMVAMVLLLVADYALSRRIPPLHALSTALVLAFGTATLILHDQRFIQWKPTAFYWLAGLAFLLSNWIGEQPLVQRMLERALQVQVPVAPLTWRRLNWLWVGFWALLGVVNLLVAWHASLSTWTLFKMLGPTLGLAAFVVAQLAWLTHRAGRPAAVDGAEP